MVGDARRYGNRSGDASRLGEAAAVEAFAKAADVAGGIAEGEPDDLGVDVGQGAFGRFPNDVGDFGGLVEDDEAALALVVEALPCGGVGLVPRGLVNAPSLGTGGVL